MQIENAIAAMIAQDAVDLLETYLLDDPAGLQQKRIAADEVFHRAAHAGHEELFLLALEMKAVKDGGLCYIIDDSNVQENSEYIAGSTTLLAHVIGARSLDGTRFRFDLALNNNKLFRVATTLSGTGMPFWRSYVVTRMLVEARHDDGSFRVDPSVDDDQVLFSSRVDDTVQLLLLKSYDQKGRLRVNPMARGNLLARTTTNYWVFKALLDCTDPVVDVSDVLQSDDPRSDSMGSLVFRDNATFARFGLHKDLASFVLSHPEHLLVYLSDRRVLNSMQDPANHADMCHLLTRCKHAHVVHKTLPLILEGAYQHGRLREAVFAASSVRIAHQPSHKMAQKVIKRYLAMLERWSDMRAAFAVAVYRACVNKDILKPGGRQRHRLWPPPPCSIQMQ